MRTFCLAAAVMILALSLSAQRAPSESQAAAVAFAEKAAIDAVSFQQGDLQGFVRNRDSFTTDGWNDFLRVMQGFLDENGAPTFTSIFVPSGNAHVIGVENGLVHLRIPGTLTQSNKIGHTSYRGALDVIIGGDPTKIHKLEQITCVGSSSACL